MKLNNFPRAIKFGIPALVISATLAAGYIYRDIPYIEKAGATTSASFRSNEPFQKSSITLPDFAGIVAQQGPAVVNISVSGTIKTGISGFPGLPQMDPNDPLFEFFRRFQGPAPQGSTPSRGFGSGFIVSPDGVILTNAHVVADADEVTVKLTDKREFKARVVGMDKVSDVAVLKIDADNLPTVKIGDDQRSRVGEWVIAIGAPFGFENSVTAGIISAKSRSLPDEGYVPFLQTDVAVNPGNSGGPLINTNGEVIGINSQIFSRSGGYQGLSFAIPIDVAMKVEQQILAHGKVSHGRLGVMIQEVNQQLADTFGLDKPTGALVSSVERNSPAEKAGIEPGDVILKFNGRDITRSADLPPLVSELASGTEANLVLWHKEKSREISLSLGGMDVAANSSKAAGQGNDELGMALRPLTPEERKQTDVDDGLLVGNVDAGPAARAGIQPGDIILSVNGEKTASIRQMKSLISRDGKHVALLILRGEQKMFVPVKIG
ncbi:MAG: DegQ family serine endoprotease [Gallionellaceae bacterium]